MRLLLRSPFSQLVFAIAVVVPAYGTAQSVVERSPNLSGGWVGEPGTVYFNFLHRFEHGAAPARKVTNFPTFLLGYAPVERVLLAAQYATNSDLVVALPNEWEVFGRWAAPAMDPPSSRSRVAGTTLPRASTERPRSGCGWEGFLCSAPRALSRRGLAATPASPSEAGPSFAWEATWRWQRTSCYCSTGRTPSGWPGARGSNSTSPTLPHSLSIQASNTNTATLEGSSRGSPKTRWGFEFTVPITLRRYFGSGAATSAGPAVASSADTVVVTISDFEFTPAQITIRPGATVVWVNEGQIAHTATADDSSWDSGVIEPGASWSRTFSEGPPQPYHCTPHPFMKGTVRISGEGR